MSAHYRDREPSGCAGAAAALLVSLMVFGALACAARGIATMIARA